MPSVLPSASMIWYLRLAVEWPGSSLWVSYPSRENETVRLSRTLAVLDDRLAEVRRDVATVDVGHHRYAVDRHLDVFEGVVRPRPERFRRV